MPIIGEKCLVSFCNNFKWRIIKEFKVHRPPAPPRNGSCPWNGFCCPVKTESYNS